MIHCSKGLFIGVDRFTALDPEQQLRASQSATKCAELFTTAQHQKFRALVETPAQGTNRLDILKALYAFARSIDAGEAGLIYVATHGFETSDGLIIAGTDFLPLLPIDTGIAVERIQQLLLEHADETARFLLLLDCCRQRLQASRQDVVFERTSVIYAAASGACSYESVGFTPLVACLTQGMARAKRLRHSAGVYCRAEDVISMATTTRANTPGGDLLSLDVRGDPLNSILFPVPEEILRPSAQMKATVRVTSCEVTKTLRSSLTDRLNRLFRQIGWNSKTLIQIGEQGVNGSTVSQIRCELGDSHVHAHEDALRLLLLQFPAIFYSMTYSWDCALPNKFLRSIAEIMHGNIRIINKATHFISWRDTSGDGNAMFQTDGSTTKCSITCVSQDTNSQLPLENIASIYKLAHSLLIYAP